MNQQEFAALLDDISVCLMTEDFDLWERRVHLPFTMVTQVDSTTMRDQVSLRKYFDLYVSACKTMALDTIFRRPVSLEDCGDDTFIATYRTELLSKGARQTDPFTSSALVVHKDGNWRMISILNARGHHGWSGHQPHQSGEHK